MPHPRSPRPLVAVLAVVALAAACSGGGQEATSTTDRVEAVRDARAVLGDPAEQLATAVAEVDDALAELRTDPTNAAVDALAEGGAQVETAARDLAAVEVATTTEDVQAASEAVATAVAAADRLVAAVDVLVEAGRQVATTDARLQELTATWDEPGSRSEIMARLEETAVAAKQLRADGPEGCPGPMRVRSAAATFVAEASRELRDRVAAYDGEGFDTRRAALDEAPFGRDADGAPRRLSGLTPDDDACPAMAEATTAVTEVQDGLDALQEALNPTDLAS